MNKLQDSNPSPTSVFTQSGQLWDASTDGERRDLDLLGIRETKSSSGGPSDFCSVPKSVCLNQNVNIINVKL